MGNHSTKHRALLYVRKSMVRHRRDEISPERQLAACRAAAEAHSWEAGEGEVYADAEGHRSGRTEEHRPAWQALKARLAVDPTVAAVVVNSLDRGSRSPKDFFNFLDLIHRQGVELVSVTEQFDTSTAIGRAFLAILMVIASLESDLASERVLDTIAHLKSRGIHWGRTPFGYTRDEDAIPQPDDNAPAVRECLAYYAPGGRGFSHVAEHLNNAGHRWRDLDGEPVPFDRYAVRSIISNVLIYAGWIPGTRGKDLDPSKAETFRELVQATGALPGLHPPLCDEELAEAVLLARRRRRALAPRRERYVYLLTPILYCAHCGQQLRGKWGSRQTGARYCHYTGARACLEAAGLDPAEVSGTHPAGELEEQVLGLLDIRLPPAVLADLRQVLAARMLARPENEELQARLGRLEGKLGRLRELYLEGDIDRDEYAMTRANLQAQADELRAELGAADYPLEAALARLGRMAGELRAGTPEQKRRILGLMLDRLEVNAWGEITEAVPAEWARPLLADLGRLSGSGDPGDIECPQGTLTSPNVAALLSLSGPPVPPGAV